MAANRAQQRDKWSSLGRAGSLKTKVCDGWKASYNVSAGCMVACRSTHAMHSCSNLGCDAQQAMPAQKWTRVKALKTPHAGTICNKRTHLAKPRSAPHCTSNAWCLIAGAQNHNLLVTTGNQTQFKAHNTVRPSTSNFPALHDSLPGV